MPENGQTGLTTGFFLRFGSPRIAPTPQKRWETAIRASRKFNPDRKFSSPPAEREHARHRGRHRRAAWWAAGPGGIGGSNRTGSGRQAPAAQRVAHRVVDRMADRRRRAGKREASRLFLRSLLPGASAGRCGRTSGVDGVDIGCATRRVKEIICKRGMFWGRPGHMEGAGGPLPLTPSPGGEDSPPFVKRVLARASMRAGHLAWLVRHAAWACLARAGLKTVWFSSIAQATPSRRSATPRSARA